MTHTIETDIIIIGAGPVGLLAIFECGMLKMRCHVIDTLDATGGQCTALYPEKPIYDIPGYPTIDAVDLITELEKQAAPFNPTYHLGQQVTTITDDGDSKIVTTSTGTTIRCKAIMLAAGGGAFGPNRPPIDAIEEYEKSGSVGYMVAQKEKFRDKRVVIAGGGDSAVDWVLSLADIAAHIDVVHRRPKFRAIPENVDQMNALAKTDKVDMIVPYQLSDLEGENGQLAAVIVADLDGKTKRLEADHLLAFYGLSMDLGPIADWGLEISKKQLPVNPATMETSRAGIFAIGDINNYAGKLNRISLGFAEAAIAAHAAHSRVHPEAELHFSYSTTTGIQGF